MPLRRKPQSESKTSPDAAERRIEALINKGGSVAPGHEEEGEEFRPQARPTPSAPYSLSSASTRHASIALSRRPVMRGCSKPSSKSWKLRTGSTTDPPGTTWVSAPTFTPPCPPCHELPPFPQYGSAPSVLDLLLSRRGGGPRVSRSPVAVAVARRLVLCSLPRTNPGNPERDKSGALRWEWHAEPTKARLRCSYIMPIMCL